MGARRRAREHALKMLYQAELAGLSADETIAVHSSREPENDPAARAFAERLVRGVLSDLPAIDELIGALSHHWRLDRLAAIDRNLLRLAIGELQAETETPPAVIIDEAVELARDYAGADSGAFVNGILEAARLRLRAGSAADEEATDAEAGDPR